MMKFLTAGLALALLAHASPSAATTYLLDFSNTGCVTSGLACVLPQTYGDGPGVDVSYHTIPTSTGQPTGSVNVWQGSYGDLTGVVYAGADATHYAGEIVLAALAGYRLSLLDFDYASYHGARDSAPFTITDLGGQTLMSFTGTTGATHSPAVVGSAPGDGVILKWGPDAYNLGVDNVRFDVEKIATGVPEPASWALMIAGFAGVGASLRRRTRLAMGEV